MVMLGATLRTLTVNFARLRIHPRSYNLRIELAKLDLLVSAGFAFNFFSCFVAVLMNFVDALQGLPPQSLSDPSKPQLSQKIRLPPSDLEMVLLQVFLDFAAWNGLFPQNLKLPPMIYSEPH